METESTYKICTKEVRSGKSENGASLIHGRNLGRKRTLLVSGSERKLNDTDDQEESESDKYSEITHDSAIHGNPKWKSKTVFNRYCGRIGEARLQPHRPPTDPAASPRASFQD